MRVDAGIGTGQGRAAVAAGAGTSKRIRGTGGLVHDRTELVVVPTVRIVVSNHHRRAVPLSRFHERIDDLNDKRLLVNWIGVSGMAILIRRSFYETDGRQVSALHHGEEIDGVVVMVRRSVMANFRER